MPGSLGGGLGEQRLCNRHFQTGGGCHPGSRAVQAGTARSRRDRIALTFISERRSVASRSPSSAVTVALGREQRHESKGGSELRGSTGPRRVAVLAALIGVYVLAGKVGLSLAFVHASASAVWPPTGIALAVPLTLGHPSLPPIFPGAFVRDGSPAGPGANV